MKSPEKAMFRDRRAPNYRVHSREQTFQGRGEKGCGDPRRRAGGRRSVLGPPAGLLVGAGAGMGSGVGEGAWAAKPI